MEEQFSNSLQIINASEERPRAFTFSGLPSNSRIFINSFQSDNLHKSISCKLYRSPSSPSSVSDMLMVYKSKYVEKTQNDVPCEKLELVTTQLWEQNGLQNKLNLGTQNNICVASTPRPNKNVNFMEIDEESVIKLSPIKEDSVNQSKSFIAIPPTVFYKKSSLRSNLNSDIFVIPDHILERQKFREKKKNVRKFLDSDVPIKKQKKYQDMKDGLRPLVLKCLPKANEHKMKSFCKGYIFLLLSAIFILLLSVYVHENQERNHSTDFANAVVELKKRIHGQDKTIHALCEYLQLDTPSSRVIALIGGTGVGKSYTVEIIKKNFPRAYAIRQYFPPIGTTKEINIPLLYPNLIILENLREHDLTDVVSFLKTRQDMYKNRLLTVLAVFNIEQMDDDSVRSIHLFRSINAIDSSFANGNINVKIIPYDTLSVNTLEKCIMDAEKDSELTLTVKQFNLVKQNLLRNNVGCKGAYSKVQVIGRTTVP